MSMKSKQLDTIRPIAAQYILQMVESYMPKSHCPRESLKRHLKVFLSAIFLLVCVIFRT